MNFNVNFDPTSIDICLSVAAVPLKRNFWILKVAAQKRDVNWLTDGRRRRKMIEDFNKLGSQKRW